MLEVRKDAMEHELVKDINEELRKLQEVSLLLDKLSVHLTPEVKGYCGPGYLSLRVKDRATLLPMIRELGGKWEKNFNHGNERVEYWQMIGHVGVTIGTGELPPGCKLEIKEVEIPAQSARIEKRKVMVCPMKGLTNDQD